MDEGSSQGPSGTIAAYCNSIRVYGEFAAALKYPPVCCEAVLKAIREWMLGDQAVIDKENFDIRTKRIFAHQLLMKIIGRQGERPAMQKQNAWGFIVSGMRTE